MQVNAALQHLQQSLPEEDEELSPEQEACLVRVCLLVAFMPSAADDLD